MARFHDTKAHAHYHATNSPCGRVHSLRLAGAVTPTPFCDWLKESGPVCTELAKHSVYYILACIILYNSNKME